MLVGVPKEIKNHERRVGLTPTSASELTRRGHSVLVETSAGTGIGASDEDYAAVGCTIASDRRRRVRRLGNDREGEGAAGRGASHASP